MQVEQAQQSQEISQVQTHLKNISLPFFFAVLPLLTNPQQQMESQETLGNPM